MKKTLASIIYVVTLAMSTTAFAQTFTHDGDKSQCDISVNGDITFEQGRMLITQQNSSVITLTETGKVWLDGQAIKLSTEETQYVTAYYQEVEEIIPKAMQLASDSIDIARVALVKVFGGLLGEDSRFVNNLDNTLESIRKELASRVYPESGVVVFGESLFSGENGFQDYVNNEIDVAVDTLMEQGMGELLMFVGKSMFSGNTDFSNLEQQIDNIANNFEQEIEQQAVQIEAAGHAICQSLLDVDAAEQQLQQIKPLQTFDVVQVKTFI